jgi:type III restriction enzyme
MKRSASPILNTPYEEPTKHYATDAEGNLDYRNVRPGRRVFVPDVPSVPLEPAKKQGSMFDINDLASEYREHVVNQLREQIARWREANYPGVTSRVTRDLLNYWFSNAERQSWQKLFYPQREAVEAAIWLNEVAEKSNAGTHLLNQLRLAQQTVGEDPADALPRIAFKMATGTGKTVVMACLILYHYLNRSEYPNDPRYSDYFLVVAPGITIRDRLGVLIPDTLAETRYEARDYYRERYLLPPVYEDRLPALAARIAITNYHAFEPRQLSGNKRTPFDGKRDATGAKQESRESDALMLRRVLGKFKPGRRLLVINDEAHHCYLPRIKGRDTEEEQSETENARAAVWFSGLRAVAERWQVRSVYDLSATPYYLSGSGYPAYSLFPWVVTDYGLVEAIEAGLVKIPFLPVDDSAQSIAEPVLRNLYANCKDKLPKKGQRTQRKEEKAAGKKPHEEAPDLPPLVKQALDQFVAHYRRYETGMRERGELGRDLLSAPPVFIVVCNNTTVSKEVFKHIAGYEYENGDGQRIVVPGMFEELSNYERDTLAARRKPPTLLIDSDALENSGQIDDDFKKIFAPEIEQFKRDYRAVHPERSVDALDETDLLREVVNTVGKPGRLGAHVRCVVSVAMLTEGWDANTVTHIMGLRAFGSQLLCEQVAGRALRRRQYFIDEKTGRFPPEYAHIVGIPFRYFKAGETEIGKRVDYQTLLALPDRAELEIRFPNVVGYRVEVPPGPLRADFSVVPDYEINLARNPAETTMGTAFSGETSEMRVNDPLAMREQEVIYWIAARVMRHHFAKGGDLPELERFAEVRAICARWYRDKLKVVGSTDPAYKKLVVLEPHAAVADAVKQGIDAAGVASERILPVFSRDAREGSTRHVHGHTAKKTYATKKSHVNFVVADTDTWEQIAAKTLERHKAVESYVKNSFLGFTIPYTQEGQERQYFPDFIARCKTAEGERFNLIVEITGFSRDKAQKRWYLEHRWLPAVNAARAELKEAPWFFVEVTDIERIENVLGEKLDAIAAEIDDRRGLEGLMTLGLQSIAHVWDNDADELFDEL